MSVCVCVCVVHGVRRKRESLAGALGWFGGGFSGLPAGVRSNLNMLHLGSARFGLL